MAAASAPSLALAAVNKPLPDVMKVGNLIRFDWSGTYGNSLLVNELHKGMFRHVVPTLVDNAKQCLPVGARIEFICRMPGASGTTDCFAECGSVAWKYDPKYMEDTFWTDGTINAIDPETDVLRLTIQ